AGSRCCASPASPSPIFCADWAAPHPCLGLAKGVAAASPMCRCLRSRCGPVKRCSSSTAPTPSISWDGSARRCWILRARDYSRAGAQAGALAQISLDKGSFAAWGVVRCSGKVVPRELRDYDGCLCKPHRSRSWRRPTCPRRRHGQVGLLQDLERCDLHRRSEEHTSELQSRENLVCRLLLEK